MKTRSCNRKGYSSGGAAGTIPPEVSGALRRMSEQQGGSGSVSDSDRKMAEAELRPEDGRSRLRLDRPGRKYGGRTGCETSPLSKAARSD